MEKTNPKIRQIKREEKHENFPKFSGKVLPAKRKGDYYCTACGKLVFSNKDRFDFGTGWLNFSKPVEEKAVETKIDENDKEKRAIVVCGNCMARLGKFFNDGPKPEGKRFCINSITVRFRAIDA